jgi:hypothetical protein
MIRRLLASAAAILLSAAPLAVDLASAAGRRARSQLRLHERRSSDDMSTAANPRGARVIVRFRKRGAIASGTGPLVFG